MQISRYNAIDLSVSNEYFVVFVVLTPYKTQEDVQEDWGWKLVHGEVFRAPRYPMILSVMAGNGAQLCAMCGVTLGSCL